MKTDEVIISEERYQELLRKSLGDEWAAISNLPEDELQRAVADYRNAHDTPSDIIWPSEGYTGPDLP